MTIPRILFVTGASGAGKTTLVRALEAVSPDGVAFAYPDADGAPSQADIDAAGGPDAWQRASLAAWLDRIATWRDSVVVVDGQFRPADALAACHVRRLRARVVLVDCDYPVRHARLRDDRGQPELITADMDRWAAYLRGQADALGLAILDTGAQPVDAAAVALRLEVEALRGAGRGAR